MTHKNTESYSRVFRFIEEKLLKLEPAEFITDFEGGMRKAVEECYPHTRLRGCWYHYSAALRKRLLYLGLNKLIKNDDNARSIKKMTMSLPLLPEEDFMQGYNHIRGLADKWKLSKKFSSFFAYFDQYWILQVSLFS